MFRLAHLSDPHVPPLPSPRVGELLNKRLLGYLSWQRRRKAVHRPEILDALCDDLTSQGPDHVVVTGDIVNISLPAEFEAAARWLGRLGPEERVTVVPGNHDAYVGLPFSEGWRHWAGYMTSEEMAGPAQAPQGYGDFPLLRRRGPLALIGLSSAVPSGPGRATGRLGGPQIEALEHLLERLGEEGLFRVVLVHHPLLDETTKRRKRLLDSAELRAAIGRSGAELLLHGHDHRFLEAEVAGRDGPVPVFGVPSASARPYAGRPGAHYFLYEVARTREGWQVTARARGLAAPDQPIAESFVRSAVLERPKAANASWETPGS